MIMTESRKKIILNYWEYKKTSRIKIQFVDDLVQVFLQTLCKNAVKSMVYGSRQTKRKIILY